MYENVLQTKSKKQNTFKKRYHVILNWYSKVGIMEKLSEGADTDLLSCSYKKVFWKYTAKLQNTHAEARFQ